MTIKNLLLSFLCALFGTWFSSCGGSNKFINMVYLADSVNESQKLLNHFEYILTTGDRIQILVTALEPQSALPYNVTPIVGTNNNTGVTLGVNIAATGYLIDPNGNIQFPQIGNIQVGGKTTNQVAKQIQDLLLQYLKDPVVMVNISNFKVNVIGEVAKPGTLIVPDGKITILEAISQTGDLTIYGKRDNILIVREKNGKREFGKVNLASKSIFESPYYYLEQGDVVYVEMNKNKLLASDADEARKMRIASLLLSSITAIAIIINAIR